MFAWVLLALQLCAVLYACYILVHAWFFQHRYRALQYAHMELPTVSIIIPARNEQHPLSRCLQAIAAQTYPAQKLAVVVVNDHSEDGTLAVAESFLPLFGDRLRIISLTDEAQNAQKKKALAAGIAATTSDIIITTDADTWAGPAWVAGMVSYFAPAVVLVSGPIHKVPASSTFFQEVQALESAGMVALGAAALALSSRGIGAPTLANGANLAFLRSAFYAVGGYTGLEVVASGDDELLLHRLHTAKLGKLVFAHTPEAAVHTHALTQVSQFVQQRIRWVSKSRAYRNPYITAGQLTAYLGIVGIAATFFVSLFKPEMWPILAILLVSKIIAESALLFQATAFLGQRPLLKWLLPAQALHMGYVLWVGIAGNLSTRYTWKGRNVR